MRAAWLFAVSSVLTLAWPVGAQRDGTPHFWPADAAPGGVQGPTPDQLLGFRFGSRRAAVERACRRAGHACKRVRDDEVLCDGAVSPSELPVQVHLRFCAGRLCEARASVHQARARVSTYARALRSLRSAFGAPPQRRLRVDHRCLAELVAGRSDRCLDREGAGVRHWWEVGGVEIFLALEHRPGGRQLEVTYRTAERLRAMSRASD